MDTDFHKVISTESQQQINNDKPVQIGNHVWIACKSTILKGSSVPDNSVIAAGSVISKKYTNVNTVYASIGEIRNRVTWSH